MKTGSSNGSSTTMSNIENRRRKNVTIRKPIVLGTYAFMLSIAEQKKRGDNATHSWTCFLRSPDNEDISYYVKKVVFSLHPSFLNPNRVVEKCPFEVTECGWGEFDIIAKIYFVDSTEKPVEIKHFLRLYPPGTTDVRNVKFPTDSTQSDCVVSETRDEFIFYEPTEKFYEKLINGPIQPFSEHRLQPYFQNTDKTLLERTLSAAHASIQNEMTTLRAEIAQITLEIQSIRESYYALRPNEVATLFPHSEHSPIKSQHNAQSVQSQPTGANSPTPASDIRDVQHASVHPKGHATPHIIDHGMLGGVADIGIPHKTEIYGNGTNIAVNNIHDRSPQSPKSQSSGAHSMNKGVAGGEVHQYQMGNPEHPIQYHTHIPNSYSHHLHKNQYHPQQHHHHQQHHQYHQQQYSHPQQQHQQKQLDGNVGVVNMAGSQQQQSFHPHSGQTHPGFHTTPPPTTHLGQTPHLPQNYHHVQQQYNSLFSNPQSVPNTQHPQMPSSGPMNAHQGYNKYQQQAQVGPQVINNGSIRAQIHHQSIGTNGIQLHQGDSSSLDHPVISSEGQAQHYNRENASGSDQGRSELFA